MGAVNQLCSKAYWLDKGRIMKAGPTKEVIAAYMNEFKIGKRQAERNFKNDPEKEFNVLKVRFVDVKGNLTTNFNCDYPIIIELICKVNNRLSTLWGRCAIVRIDGTNVYEFFSSDNKNNPLDNLSEGNHRVRIVIPPRTIGPGEYLVSLFFTSPVGQKNKKVEELGAIGSFSLDDFTTSAGNARRGFLSTISDWQCKKEKQ